ncbi:MAG TPA: hypothetical protein VGB69_06070 [Edaphobacter sp.]
MTPEERALLPSLIDHAVVLETTQGDRIVAQILVVYDEGETPDLFYVEIEPGPDGTWSKKGTAGYSILLADIARVERAVLPESNQ